MREAALATPANASADETIRFNPFRAPAGSTPGDRATNPTSGTALHTPRRDGPMAINVITSAFLSDSRVGPAVVRVFDCNASFTPTPRPPGGHTNGSFTIRGSAAATDACRLANRRTIRAFGVTGDFQLTRDTTRLALVSTRRSSGISPPSVRTSSQRPLLSGLPARRGAGVPARGLASVDLRTSDRPQ